MKKYPESFQICLYFILFSLLGGRTNESFQYPLDNTGIPSGFQQSILNPNRLNISQSFSIMSSMGNGYSQNSAVYSNFATYQISQKLQLKTGLHFIQSRNQLPFLPANQSGLGYQFGLEYQLGENSLFSFEFSNSRNMSPFFLRDPLP